MMLTHQKDALTSRRTATSRKSFQLWCISIIVLLAYGIRPASAQEFPNFTNYIQNSSIGIEYGLGIVPYGSSVYPSALFMTYVSDSQTNELAYAYSLDGTTYQDRGVAIDHNTGSRYYLNCNAGNPATCAPGITTYSGSAYIAYADENTGGLNVVQVTQIPGNEGWYFNLVYTNTSVHLTSAPALVVYQNKLLIIYGTSNTSQHNSTYVTALSNGAWSTYPQNGYAPTQSGLAVYGNTLYALMKQNNSDNGVFVSQLDQNGVYIPGTSQQISGFYTGAGISLAVFKGSLIAAVQQNTSSHYLYIFSSTDGINWARLGYTAQVGQTPQLTPYNNGLALAFKSNDQSNVLFTSFATQ